MCFLNSEDYASIAEVEEFKELNKRENYFNLSVEEVTKKADEILLNAAKSGKADFAKADPQKVSAKRLPPVSLKKISKGRYGGAFNKRN